jgi:hypothetical protein
MPVGRVRKCKDRKDLAEREGLESSLKRSYNNLYRGRWHLTRLIRSSSVLTARKWHGGRTGNFSVRNRL